MAKPSGIRLNRISAAELAAAVICFLIMLPFATSAYRNFTTRSAYNTAIAYWMGRDYVKARDRLETCVEQRPNTYFPHELLAMCYYYQGDVQKAAAKFKEVSTAAELSGHQRAVLAEMAQTSIKLELLKKKKGSTINDGDYGEAKAEAEKQATRRGFLEAQLVKAQLNLDGMPEATDAKSRKLREATLDQVISEVGELEKKAAKSPASARGMAVLYNTLGVANFEMGMLLWDDVQPEERAAPKPSQKMTSAADYTAKAVRYFTRAIQYKTYWPQPYINFERAMGVKLIEDGMSTEERKQWVDRALIYDKMRDEHLMYLKTMGHKPDKELPLDKSVNKYIFYCAIGWAFALLEEWNRSQHYLNEAVSKMQRKDVSHAAVDRARSAARYWKSYEGYKTTRQKQLWQAREQAKKFYRQGLQRAAAPIQRVRLLNNWAVYLILSRQDILGARDKIREACALVKKLEGQPAYASQVARENLSAKTDVNYKRILQLLAENKKLDKRQRAQFKAEMASGCK